MAQTVEDLLVRVDAQTESLRRELRRADQQLGQFGTSTNRRLQKIDRGFQRLNQQAERVGRAFRRLQGAAIAVAGAGGLGVLVGRSLAATANLRDLASRAGVTTGALQELTFAAQRYGVQQDTVVDGLRELQVRASEFATTGKGEAADAFKLIGLNARQAQRLVNQADNGFGEIIRRIRQLDDQAARAQAFDELFGGEAGERIRQLTGDIGQLRQEARDLGIVISDQLIRQADQARDTFDVLTDVISKRFQVAIAEVAPQINDLLTRILDQLPEFISGLQSAAEWLGILDKRASAFGTDGRLASAFQEQEQFLRGLADSAGKVSEAFFNASESGNFKQLNARLNELANTNEQLRGIVQGIREDYGKTIDSTEELDAAYRDLNRVIGNAKREASEYSDVSQMVADTMALVRDTAPDAAEQIRNTGDAAGDASEEVAKLNVDYADLRKRMDAVNPAIEAHRSVLDGTANAAKDVEEETKKAEDATRDLGIQTQSTADIMRGAFEEVGRSIQSGIRDALLGAERNIVETAKRIAADIVAAFATQRIIIPAFIQPVAGALGLGGGASSAAAGQGGATGGLGGVSNIASAGSLLNNIGSGLTTPTFSAQGLANFAPSVFQASAVPSSAASGTVAAGVGGNVPGLAGTGTAAAPNTLASSVSAATTPLAIGGGLIGGIGANLAFGGGVGTSVGSAVGGTGGALAGAAIGSAIPGIGTVIGAGIGSLLGSFGGGGVGSLFGPGPSSEFISRGIKTEGGRLRVNTRASLDSVSDETKRAFDQVSQQVNSSVNQFLDQIGGRLVNTAASVNRTRDGVRIGVRGRGTDFRFEEVDDLSEIPENLIPRLIQRGDVRGISDLQSRVLSRSLELRDGNLQQVGSDLQLVQQIEQLRDQEKFTETELQIRNVRDRFDQLIDRADKLGLETGVLVRRRDEEIKAIREQADAIGSISRKQRFQLRGQFENVFGNLSIKRQLIAGGIGTLDNPAGVLIRENLDRIRNGLSSSAAESLGTEILDVARSSDNAQTALSILSRAMERFSDTTAAANDNLSQSARLRAEVAARESALNAASQLRSFLNQQTLSQDSTLGPLERVEAAQRQFRERLGEVRGGDLQAVDPLLSSAQSLLDIGRQAFASTGDFASIEQFVRSNLQSVGEQITSTRFIGNQISEAVERAGREQTDELKAIKEEIRELREENRDLRQALEDAA